MWPFSPGSARSLRQEVAGRGSAGFCMVRSVGTSLARVCRAKSYLFRLDALLAHQLRPLRLIAADEASKFVRRIAARVGANGLHSFFCFRIGQNPVRIEAELVHG